MPKDPRQEVEDAIASLRRVALEEHRAGRVEAADVIDRQARSLIIEAGFIVGHLKERDRGGNAGSMVGVQRVRVSSGKNAAAGKDPLVVAANAHGFTLRSLAETLKVSHALLSQARKGTSSIDRALAERIQELTGFAATKAHWPKIRA